MGQVVELVVECVAEHGLLRLLTHASRMGTVLDADVDGVQVSATVTASQICHDVTSSATIRMVDFDIPVVGSIRGVVLRVLQTAANTFDLEVSLDLDDVSQPADLSQGLFDLGQVLAEYGAASSYFAGLEPASDMDTRFFTDNEWGPYRLPMS